MPHFNAEPSLEDIAWYSEMSQYIGFHKPDIVHTKEEGLTYSSEHEARCAEGDYMPMDDQPYD